mmetsp:Transcript_115251/g.222161  ORF Transcript_115251/g.222161 Transcript_115251/m.222161 type:complete len:516 (+) Transcript_115251:78-1625(+)
MRSRLPNRRRNMPDGPGYTLKSFGAVGFCSAASPRLAGLNDGHRKDANSPSDNDAHGPKEPCELPMDPDVLERMRWELIAIVDCLRKRGHNAQVNLSKHFSGLPEQLSADEIGRLLAELHLTCLDSHKPRELHTLVQVGFGPFPTPKGTILRKLRGEGLPGLLLRTRAIEHAFVRLSPLTKGSLQESYAPKAHPSALARRKSSADVLQEFFDLLVAEGLSAVEGQDAEEVNFDAFARLSAALGLEFDTDSSFTKVLAQVFPGNDCTAFETMGTLIKRAQSALHKVSAQKLERLSYNVADAVQKGISPAELIYPSPPVNPISDYSIIASVPPTSHPLFAAATVETVAVRAENRPMHRREFVVWASSVGLLVSLGVTEEDAECLFVYFDEDRSGQLTIEELTEMLCVLAGEPSQSRSEAISATVRDAPEEMQLKLKLAAALLSPVISDDSDFKSWLSDAACGRRRTWRQEVSSEDAASLKIDRWAFDKPWVHGDAMAERLGGPPKFKPTNVRRRLCA